MPGAFYEWLLSVDPLAADFLKRKGVPTKSSRLYTLLRGCRDSSVRKVIKDHHRKWRNKRVQLFTVPQMHDAGFSHECDFFRYRVSADHRWPRVMRRWEAKHPEKLIPIVNSDGDIIGMRGFISFPINYVKNCPTCEGSGVVYAHHDFSSELLGCHDCNGSGKA